MSARVIERLISVESTISRTSIGRSCRVAGAGVNNLDEIAGFNEGLPDSLNLVLL